LLRALGVTVVTLPYELHPEIPARGVELPPPRQGGRTEGMYERIARECHDAGLRFRRPARLPNTRRALEVSEVVRQEWPDAFEGLERRLFEAHFADGLDIGDPAVVDELVDASGADPGAVDHLVASGRGGESLQASMQGALEAGVTGTPAWLLDGRLMVPGLQARELFERVVSRLRDRPVT
jgi:predicted DsbA family dithiol-disulfide isomerase